tara:strand:- start:125 stop:349 length:225 start_codon:yes stop_codon:yes gene_type:complete
MLCLPFRQVKGVEKEDLIMSFCLASLNAELQISQESLAPEAKLSICECFINHMLEGFSIDDSKSICIAKEHGVP